MVRGFVGCEAVVGQVAELRGTGYPGHRHSHVGATTAILGNNHIDLAGPVFRVKLGWPMQKQHFVGVLFNRARFPQIRLPRSFVLTSFQVAIQLRQHHDRDTEFFRQYLERLGDTATSCSRFRCADPGSALMSCR